MAIGTYAPDPDLRVVDANGVPVPGGLVWTYIAGTVTPTPTYTDVGLTVANTNPIVAGSDGRFVAFLAGGVSYKFVYEMPAIPPAHGAGLFTRDNIQAVTTITPGTGGGVLQNLNLSGTVNDFALLPGCTILFCNNSSLLTLTGLSGGVSGQRLTIVANSSGPVGLVHASTASLAGNRFWNVAASAPTMLGVPVGMGGCATYIYTGGIWYLIAHEQGPWLSSPFNAADFGSNTGAWTVAAGNITGMRYRLSGRTLHVAVAINGFSVTGTPSVLTIASGQFNGYSFGSGSTHVMAVGTMPAADMSQQPFITQSDATHLAIQKAAGAQFSSGTNYLYAEWFGEVI